MKYLTTLILILLLASCNDCTKELEELEAKDKKIETLSLLINELQRDLKNCEVQARIMAEELAN